MPCQPGKARRLLHNGKATVVRREPFTIQLLYGSSGYKQKISLGIDAGSKHVGASASTEKKELYTSQTELRGNDIVRLVSTRKELRRSRRSRKTRYRKPRFLNRVGHKQKGWLAPSVENKITAHLRIVADIYKILPIASITVEVASFDMQKIKKPDIAGKGYQQGEQVGFWNVREYVIFRDNHECQCCHGKSRDKVLNVHHIESRKTGGDAPNNLVTLCKTCHIGYHQGTTKLPAKIRRGMSFRDAAFMGIMRWILYDRMEEIYNNVRVTFGYITKNTRIRNKITKTHCADAFCIAGHVKAERLPYFFLQKQIRKHNRQIHKQKIYKGGKRKLNQSAYTVKGFRLFDKVRYTNQDGFIFGRRSSGYFDLRRLDGTVIHRSASWKDLHLLRVRSSTLIEREMV